MGRSEVESEEHQRGRSSRDKERDRDDDRDRDRERERAKEREKVRDREKEKERERERDRSHRDNKDKLRDRDRDRERDRDRGRERARERDYDKEKDRRDKEREREYDRDRDRDYKEKEGEPDGERDKDRVLESSKDLEKDSDRDRDKIRDKDEKEKKKDRGKHTTDADRTARDVERSRDGDRVKDPEFRKDKDREREKEKGKVKSRDTEREARGREKENEKDKELENEQQVRNVDIELESVTLEAGEIDVQEEKPQGTRKGKNEGGSSGNEILAWVNKSRTLEEQKKIEERIKAAKMARLFMEQEGAEDMEESGEDNDEGDRPAYGAKDLAGLKVLHGIDRVMEGGAVVLTLKDRSILQGDDINDETDELENLEIAQQRAREESYKAAKKKVGVYEDKFQNDINAIRTILPQYDDEIKDSAMELDETGGLNEDGIRRLEELKQKLQGAAIKPHESLSGGASVASDFYTQEEMLQFNKPKKKKKLRKREKVDLDALAALAKADAEVMGEADHGSRSSTVRQTMKLEQQKAEEESRKAAYMNAYTKALDASLKLKVGNNNGNSDSLAEEDDELDRFLQRARQAALKKQSEKSGASVGPQAVFAALQQSSKTEVEIQSSEDHSDKEKGALVFTDTEEFCRSLQLEEVRMRRPGTKDAFAEDDEPANDVHVLQPDGGWMEVKEEMEDVEMQEQKVDDDSDREDVVQEVTVGKGLSGALHLLKERGTLKETVEWGGRNMDKKKSKLVGIVDQEEKFRNREILLDRLDEFGRTMTPKEAFRKISHKFHGKGPGKMKQEKKMKQYEEEMKLKQMSSGDTPLLSMQKMREAQAKLHTPYIVISGHIKPGQTSDPRSGFATVEKESVGSLTPILGAKKVEHFLGIKRKPEGGSMKPPLPKKS